MHLHPPTTPIIFSMWASSTQAPVSTDLPICYFSRNTCFVSHSIKCSCVLSLWGRHLEGALDRFCQFFYEPLFNQDCTER